MTDIASSLEQEFADVSQAEQASAIAELKKIEAAGRGSADIRPHAIALPLLFGVCGGVLAYAALTSSARIYALPIGLALLLPSLWALLGPRKPRFTLTEEGVRVKDVLLPWSSIEDYGVTENSYNGFTTHTSVTLLHAGDYAPPKLGLLYPFGGSIRNRKTGQHETRLTLHAGAKGMNSEKLAQRIGEFFAAAHARAELARLRAD